MASCFVFRPVSSARRSWPQVATTGLSARPLHFRGRRMGPSACWGPGARDRCGLSGSRCSTPVARGTGFVPGQLFGRRGPEFVPPGLAHPAPGPAMDFGRGRPVFRQLRKDYRPGSTPAALEQRGPAVQQATLTEVVAKLSDQLALLQKSPALGGPALTALAPQPSGPSGASAAALRRAPLFSNLGALGDPPEEVAAPAGPSWSAACRTALASLPTSGKVPCA